MKPFLNILFLFVALLIESGSICAGDYITKKDSIEGGIRIAWDYSSMQKLAPLGNRKLSWAGYPRVRRLADGTVLAVYETGREVEMLCSRDNGVTWEGPVVVFEQKQYANAAGEATDIRAANPELYQLQNGDLVAACNYRPVKNEIAPFSIAVKRSTDNGETWSKSRIIYEAEPRFTDGCWEPAFLQLPGGELQVYFANEAPYTHSNEQEISMMSSGDNGITWDEKVKTVSFRKGKRDGMPAPLLVDEEILVAIEDNNVEPFKPYIVRTTVSKNWDTPVYADSKNREYALKDSLPENVYAGAPYLMRVPSGEVVMSYQTTSQRTSNWEMSTMEVAIGDKSGRNFNKLTRPFDVPLNKEAKWNSISLWDERTIVAAASTSFRSPGVEVWIIKGKIIPELIISQKTVSVDGVINEWNEELPIFIGSRSETNLSAALGFDAQNLYFCATVNDGKLIYDSENPQNSDGVVLYFAPAANSPENSAHAAYKVVCSHKGDVITYAKKNDEWKNIKAEGVAAEIKIKENEGYQLELVIPFTFGNINQSPDMLFTIGLAEKTGSGEDYTEYIVNSHPDSPQSWLQISLKEN